MPLIDQDYLRRAALARINVGMMPAVPSDYDTKLDPDEEAAFQQWKAQVAPNDSGEDYDLRGAFKSGFTPDPETGHFPDQYKKPNHPTFSDQSQYAIGNDAAKAGHWAEDNATFIPPGALDQGALDQGAADQLSVGMLPAVPLMGRGPRPPGAEPERQFLMEDKWQPPVTDWQDKVSGFVDTLPPPLFAEPLIPGTNPLSMTRDVAEQVAQLHDAGTEAARGQPITHPWLTAFNAATMAPIPGARGAKLAVREGEVAARRIGEALEGLPRSAEIPGHGSVEVGPHPPARAAAEEYMQGTKLPYEPPTEYKQVDPHFAGQVADAYGKMVHQPIHPDVKQSYNALKRELVPQFKAIEKTGLKIEFIKPDMENPYAASPRLAVEDIKKNNHLWVYPTESGFGSDAAFDASDNPLLGKTGVTIDGKRVRYNDLFRIVHDYFGHVKEGVGFRATGEENAYLSHAAMFSPKARAALATETRGQNSWLNFGPHGAANRTAKEGETVFADQKVGLLPRWARGEGPAPADELKQNLSGYFTTEPSRIIEKTHGKKSGYTVNLASGHEPTTGLMVGKYRNDDPRNLVVPGRLERMHVIAHAKKNKGALKSLDNYFGAWREQPSNTVYLDVSKRFEPDQLRSAVKFGEKTGQKAGFDVEKDSIFTIGNYLEHIKSEKFHSLMDQFAAKGRAYMAEQPTKSWWPFKGSSMERVYGKDKGPQTIGFTATTSSNTTPTQNVQQMSEYQRRHIKGEPMIQPEWRSPDTGKRMGLEADPRQDYLGGGRSHNLEASNRGDLEALRGQVVRGKAAAMSGEKTAVMDRWWARLSEDIDNNIFSGSQEGAIDDDLMPHLLEQIETAAKRNGEDVDKYSADVWAGVREHVKKFGELNGQQYDAAALGGESKSYYDIFDDLIAKKAKKLGISVKEMETRLRKGDANLLSMMLATPFVARLMQGGPAETDEQ